MNSQNNYKVLLVDDDPQVLAGLELLFEDEYCTISASSGAKAVNLVKNDNEIAVVVMDIKMPGMDGITAGREIRQIAPETILIFHTGYPGRYSEDEIDNTEEPFDYVEKGASVSRLKRAVKNGMKSYLASKNSTELSENAERLFGMVGKSQGMREIYKIISKVAPSNSKIMILGETGTGKELVARAVHKYSKRHENRLVIFNCNHKPPDLVESELFGHGKGAFTGAVSSRIGLFEYADGGTVFLDEIGDLDITTQAKILRVLESGEFQTIGDSPELKKTDVRVICATHHDLELSVKEGKFREDLYYRLKGVVVTMPPLRERKDDIPLLVNHFSDKITIEQDRMPVHFESSAMQVLMNYNWPGNVRQLQDTIESLIVLSDSDLIIDTDVNRYLKLRDTSSESIKVPKSLADRTVEFRKNCIIEALEKSDNNVSKAARLLEVDPSNLRKWIKSYGIEG